MKKFQFALMVAATLAFIACKPNEPVNTEEEEGEGDEFVSKVNVTDNSIAEWDNLPAEYVKSATCAEGCTKFQALKSVKVYADKMYINILVEFDDALIVDREWVPFHVYLDADNSDATGGYADEFADANTEWMLETAIISAGAGNSYNPSVWKWWGEVGGSGWSWSDPEIVGDESNFWGAVIGEGQAPIGASQLIGNKCEIQLLREAIPATWNPTQFGIGFDIQQNWSSVGVLPNAADDVDGNAVLAAKLKVNIDMAD